MSMGGGHALTHNENSSEYPYLALIKKSWIWVCPCWPFTTISRAWTGSRYPCVTDNDTNPSYFFISVYTRVYPFAADWSIIAKPATGERVFIDIRWNLSVWRWRVSVRWWWVNLSVIYHRTTDDTLVFTDNDSNLNVGWGRYNVYKHLRS